VHSGKIILKWILKIQGMEDVNWDHLVEGKDQWVGLL
jgi:hypothetical protein